MKILKDPDDFSEIGVFGVGINFDSVTDIISSSRLPTSMIVLFDENDEPFYCSEESVLQQEEYGSFLTALQSCSSEVGDKGENLFRHVTIPGYDCSVNTVYNTTTGWKIVHVLDNSIISEASRTNLQRLTLVFLTVVLLAMLLAFCISQQLSRSIQSLCRQIDECELLLI